MNAERYRVEAESFASFLLGDTSKGERRRIGEEVVGRCPLPDHEDRNPSFRYNPLRDCSACSCKAATGKGSTLRALLGWKGNGPAYSTPTKANGSKGTSPGYATEDEAVAAILGRVGGAEGGRWRYTPSFTVLRINTKSEGGTAAKEYRPLRCDPDGRWRFGDPPGPLPLYRLSDLATVSRVVVVEGEKCAEVAVRFGFVATTSAHGAKSAKRSAWGALAGRDVAILPDADREGRAYAEDVAAILRSLVPPARPVLVELPGLAEAEDLADWTAKREAEGKTLDAIRAELEDLIAKAAPPSDAWPPPLSVEELFNLAVLPVEWIVDPLLARGQVTLFVGGPKSGKSNLSLALALGIQNGNWPCGALTIPAAAKVAYLSFEDGKRRIARRLLKFAGQIPGGRFPSIWGSESVPDLKLPRDEEKLIAWIRAGGFEVLILDVLLFSADVKDESSSAEMQPWCASVRRIADATGVALLILHHKRKGQRNGDSIADLARGSSVVAGLADSILVLERQDETHLTLEQTAKDAPPARWTVTYDHAADKPWTIEPAGDKDFGNKAKVREALETATAKTPGAAFPASTIATVADVSENVARACLKALVAEGKATETKREGKGGGSAYTAKNY